MKPALFAVNSIVFDLDGTLVDTAPDLHRATNYILDKLGREGVSLESVRHMVGFGAKKLMELGLEATGGTGSHDLDALLPEFLEFYRENLVRDSKLYPGTLVLLQSLQDQGFNLAICTNKPTALATPLLDALDIKPFFPVITGGDSFTFRKPDPRHLLETVKLLGAEGPALMVGDSINDISAAIDAGMHSVAVTFGYTDIAPERLGADITIDRLSSLEGLVQLCGSGTL